MYRLKTRTLITAALAALLALGVLASPALAAPKATWSSIEVRWIVGSSGGPAVLVGGELPQATKLPASVTLAVPKGTAVSWAGEIVGTDPSKDPSVQYTTRSEKDYDAIDFTLSKAPRGQVEYDAPASLVTSGDKKAVTLAWTSPVAVPLVNLAIQAPQGAKVTEAGGTSSSGGGAYVKTFKDVKPGQKLEVKFAYTGGTAAPAGQPQGQPAAAPQASSDATQAIVPVLVLGLVLAGTFVLLKSSGKREPSAEPKSKRPAPAPRTKESAPAASRPEDDGAFRFDDDDASRSGAPAPAVSRKRTAAAAKPTAKPAAKPAPKSAAKPKASGAKKGTPPAA